MSVRRGIAATGAAVLLLTAGCGGDDGLDVNLRVVSPDNNIRLEDVECAGANPFEYLHAGADYTLEDADGEVLAEGELPPGRSVNADPSIDWGVDRIPTVCVIDLELSGVPERASYRLLVPPGPPLSFDASLLSGDEPLELTAQ